MYTKNGILRVCFFIFILSGFLSCQTTQKSSITKGPYLQTLKQTEITIAWECDSACGGKVHYGEGESLSEIAEAKEPLKVQKIILKNLKPETKYSYQVEVGRTKTKKYTFRTTVKEGSSFSFAAYGDNKNGPFNHKKLTDLILTYKPLFVVNNGDLVERGYVYQQWEKLFFTPAKDMMAEIPLVPAIGNHEENADYYYNYFCLPDKKAWSSFDINDAHFIVVNTEELFLFDKDEQLNWLKKDLENNKSTWTFVFQHVPPFTSGGNYYAGSRIDIKNLLHPIYEKYGVDMVLCGHDHHYERTKPIGSDKTDHAVTYIVGGNGGTPMRYIGRPKEFSLNSSRTFGFSLIKINGDKMIFKEISIDDKVLDEFELDKSNPSSVALYFENKVYFQSIPDPVQVSKLYSKGKKLYREKEYDKALSVLKEAYKIDNTCEEATAMIAQCYYKLKNNEEAKRFAEITIKIAPLHPDSYEVMASIYKDNKEYDKAIDWLNKQLNIEPDTPDALDEMASIYKDQNQYDLAVDVYLRALDILYNDWQLHFKLAELYEKMGNKNKALAEYKLAVEWFYDEEEDEDLLIAIRKIKHLSN